MKEMDEFLKENLLPDCVPEKSLNASIVKKVKGTQNMKHRTWKLSVAAAIAILVVGSASAYAAYRYLSYTFTGGGADNGGWSISKGI